MRRINYIYSLMLLSALLFLTACQTNVPLTVVDQKNLGVNQVRVISASVTKMGAVKQFSVGGKVQTFQLSRLKEQVERTARANLASVNGPRKVNVHIAIVDYYMPNKLASAMLGTVPYFNTDVSLIDAKTGKVIGGKRRVSITNLDFKSMNWAFSTPYGKANDHQYYPMVGLYGRKLRRWLTTQPTS